MKNAKFFLKCILAILPVLAVIIYTAIFPYGYMDNEYPSWRYTKDVAKDCMNMYTAYSNQITDGPSAVFVAEKITPDTVIIGDSRAMADLIPEQFDGTACNLSVGGATSIEMYYTLNNFIKNNGAPENVIIMFAPFHYTIIDNFWTRTAYFNYLSITDMTDLYSYAEATESETLMKSGYKNDLLSYRLRFPDKYLPALINSKFISRSSDNQETYNRIAGAFGYGEFGTADGCSDLNYETSYDRMHTTQDAVLIDIYVNKLLKLCEDNNISTNLSIPPMNSSSVKNLQASYVEELTEYFNELKRKHPSINIENTIPEYDDTYFGDSSHLNKKGAERFTEEYISAH